MAEPLNIPCPECGLPMQRREEFREDRIAFDHYRCADMACGRNVGVIFEPKGGFSEDETTFVEREIARRGAFFPSDFTGGPGRGIGGGRFR